MNRTLRYSMLVTTFMLALIFGVSSAFPVLADSGTIPPTTNTSPGGRTYSSRQSSLSQVPSGTKVMIVDSNGNKVSMGSQDAAAILNSGDPIWCPDGILPVAGNGGCSASYTSFSSLLADLSALNGNTGVDANGTIWFEDSYVSSINDPGVNSFTLDGGTLTTWAGHSLTLQGGWTGDNGGTINPSEPSQFNATLNILNWNGDVTLNDLLFTQTNGPGMNVTFTGIGPSARGASLAITTTGNVKLSNVDATENPSNGVLIDNRSGSGAVIVDTGNFSNNGTSVFGGLGIYVLSKGPISVNDVTANANGWAGAMLFNDNIGAQGGIILTGTNVFNGNIQDGLMLSSTGSINVSNTTADANGLTGAYMDNAFGLEDVTFAGVNQFNNNVGSGLYVYSDGVITVNNVTASGNGSGGIILINGLYAPSKNIVFTGTNVFQGNQQQGLYIGMDNSFVTYDNLSINGTAIVGPLSSDQLPGALPEGNTLIAAVQVIQGPPTSNLVISFPIPAGQQNANFSILYWDNTQWRDLSTANFDDDRTVIDPGHMTGNGYYEATVNFGGTFVLVEK